MHLSEGRLVVTQAGLGVLAFTVQLPVGSLSVSLLLGPHHDVSEQVLSSPSFRCFTSKDVIGVEVGGAVKNVIALAAGMCEGLGLGATDFDTETTRLGHMELIPLLFVAS